MRWRLREPSEFKAFAAARLRGGVTLATGATDEVDGFEWASGRGGVA
jgi:hypothetical protein